MRIGAYECVTPLTTAGSGSAHWCVAVREGQKYFLKQFLSPVQPDALSSAASELRHRQRERCEAFERRKTALYAALRCTLGDCVVPVTDFFAFEGRYYAVSEYLPQPMETLETIGRVSPQRARKLLGALAYCLGRLHAQGIVHADLKPEHVLLQRDGEEERVRLIDFDSGFTQDDPPAESHDIEGDPVYLAPETFLRISGQPGTLNRKLDTFAFGITAHRLWTGELPSLAGGATYPYEAALSGSAIQISEELPPPLRWLIGQTLAVHPEDRPDDGLLERLLSPSLARPRAAGLVENGLTRFWLEDWESAPDQE
ncbi:MAG: protein kinase [Eubacteriales bacterium]|nr:protein kinase [Eubacteriales bacterium]